ncbi:fucose permease [Plasticicumulans lactativorans]|uniref:Fucose permease n=1 Tax=Plasticicumulans lactativorans TaxID=1133106 RepID=A0A4V2SD84_9GAMM|nr:MFS transporter [Plasticicumulans lactativorans]TCO82360.1 fucose permease [Plasticicumulans lactativorans]
MTNPDPIAVPLPGCTTDDPAPGARALRRARWATRGLFASLGVLAGAWGAHIPSVQAKYQLDPAMLSTVLLAAACGALLSLFFAGRLIGRIGVRRAAPLAALVMGSMLALALTWPGLALLLPAMVVFGAAMSLFDVAINAEGTALESLSGRAVMSNLHGMFSVGGMAGAALVAALLRAGVAPLAQLAGIGLFVAALAVAASRGMLDAHPHDDEPKAHFAWPRGLLLLIGLLIFAGMTAEGVMYDWCVLYLKQEVGMPQAQAALGYATFSAAMALARFGADALRARYPERWLLSGGALLSALAMAVVLLSGHPGVSLVGYALVGAGLAPVVPILYNAATKVPGTSRAAAIASVSSIGYAGFMIGPPLIGSIAQVASLTAAMAVVVVAAVLLALGARRAAPN